MKETRKLADLIGIGPATLKDFKVLGIETVSELKVLNPQKLYDDLCKKSGKKHDICMLDVFCAAVAQAKNSELSKDKCNWWYWSQERKQKR